MMQRRSPPKHRHDGTSPLPLGMDWSSPPRKWNGRDSVWPHDARTGWSYCVTIPSWVVLPKSRDSDPVVFYRVQVGLQSPEGLTTIRGVLRRFNDFLKLFTDLKKSFPKKSLPPAPPKGLLRMKSRVLLEERRRSLEEWMTKLLSDIDLSRSAAVASFLELEAAARSSFQDVDQQAPEPNAYGNSSKSSLNMLTSSSFSPLVGSSSVTSDYGSDTAYETSELGTPRLGMDDSSEIGLEDLTLDEDLTNPIEKLAKYGMSNIDEGLFMGQTILDQLEGLNKHKSQGRHVNKLLVKDTYNGNGSKDSLRASNGMGLFLEPEPGNMARHAHKLSSESVGSEGSSLRGSEMSNSGIPNLNLNGYLDLRGGAEVSSTMDIDGNTELQVSGDSRVILPMDQRNKMNRVLLTMKQRLVTAKTDMEDLIARLNQEIAVKDYLTTKVKDLELELETDKQRNKENLQQAILVEKERLTQMKWDMEELRRKSLEMELQLQSKQDDKPHTEQTEEISLQERDKILLELDTTKQQLQNMSRRNEELEAKSKADIKILVKEVKSLRSSQSKLKQELGRSLTDKSEAENFLREERQMNENLKVGRQKLLHECSSLYNRLMECNTNLLSIDEEGKLVEDSSNLEGALDLLTTSDDRIALLLAEAQLLANGDETATDNVIIQRVGDDELRKMLASIFIENAKLRKQVNFFIRRALKLDTVSPYEN